MHLATPWRVSTFVVKFVTSDSKFAWLATLSPFATDVDRVRLSKAPLP
jgi:hypothetical protein